MSPCGGRGEAARVSERRTRTWTRQWDVGEVDRRTHLPPQRVQPLSEDEARDERQEGDPVDGVELHARVLVLLLNRQNLERHRAQPQHHHVVRSVRANLHIGFEGVPRGARDACGACRRRRLLDYAAQLHPRALHLLLDSLNNQGRLSPYLLRRRDDGPAVGRLLLRLRRRGGHGVRRKQRGFRILARRGGGSWLWCLRHAGANWPAARRVVPVRGGAAGSHTRALLMFVNRARVLHVLFLPFAQAAVMRQQGFTPTRRRPLVAAARRGGRAPRPCPTPLSA